MLTHVDHIGIAVFSLSEAEPRWTSLLGVGPYKKEEVDSEGVNTLFYLVGSTKIELLESTQRDGPIALFLEKKGRRDTPHRFFGGKHPRIDGEAGRRGVPIAL